MTSRHLPSDSDTLSTVLALYRLAMGGFIVQCLERHGNSEELIRIALTSRQRERFDQSIQRLGDSAFAMSEDMFPKVVSYHWWETFSWGFDHYVQIREQLWQVVDIRNDLRESRRQRSKSISDPLKRELLTRIVDILHRIGAHEQSRRVQQILRSGIPDDSHPSAPASDSQGLLIFKNDDDGYRDWLLQHPQGYVLNANGDMKTTSDMRLHRANCRTLEPERYRTLTVNWYKVCSTDKTAIQQWVQQKYRVIPASCGICRP